MVVIRPFRYTAAGGSSCYSTHSTRQPHILDLLLCCYTYIHKLIKIYQPLMGFREFDAQHFSNGYQTSTEDSPPTLISVGGTEFRI